LNCSAARSKPQAVNLNPFVLWKGEKPMIVKVSLAFARLTDAELDNFAHGVSTGMTGNTAFASPPVPMVNLNAAIVDFTAKVAAAQAGGPMDTAAKNTARQTLLGMLRQLATYVQMMCNNDDAVLLSSGFSAQGPRSASTALEQPQSLSVDSESGGDAFATHHYSGVAVNG
jgi:hypothetical protein